MSIQTKSLLTRAYRFLPAGWSGVMDRRQRRRFGPGRAPGRIDVITSVGSGNSDILQVMMLSLARSHPQDRIVFWLMHLGLRPVLLTALEDFAAGLGNLEMRTIAVPDKEPFRRLSALGGRPFGVRFLWMIAHRHLPDEVTRALYIDPLDTLVTDDLTPFLHHPFLGRYMVACREFPNRPPLISGPAGTGRRRSDAALRRLVQGVVNTGSMVLNLEKMRRDGLSIDDYLKVAEWARTERNLSFGDQGLYALTHGSNYVQAHDRYNLRGFTGQLLPRGVPAAVVHFAGPIPKPYHLRLNEAQEAAIAARLREAGQREFMLNDTQRIGLHHLPYYRAWWRTCAETPVHARIAPLADATTAEMLAAAPGRVPARPA